jgi:hypothetical protein
MSKIFYGISYPDECIDVTEIAIEKCKPDGITLLIPVSDPVRAELFTDPFEGKLKVVFIVEEDGVVHECDHETLVEIPEFK